MRVSQVALVVKKKTQKKPAAQRTLGSIPGQEDSLDECMATYSSSLAWRILTQRKLGYSPQGRKLSNTTEATWHGGTQAKRADFKAQLKIRGNKLLSS